MNWDTVIRKLRKCADDIPTQHYMSKGTAARYVVLALADALEAGKKEEIG